MSRIVPVSQGTNASPAARAKYSKEKWDSDSQICLSVFARENATLAAMPRAKTSQIYLQLLFRLRGDVFFFDIFMTTQNV